MLVPRLFGGDVPLATSSLTISVGFPAACPVYPFLGLLCGTAILPEHWGLFLTLTQLQSLIAKLSWERKGKVHRRKTKVYQEFLALFTICSMLSI